MLVKYVRLCKIGTTFFSELSDVLDRLATSVKPLFIVGDLNIHLEKSTDTSAIQLVDVFVDYGLSCRINKPTHNCGSLLDIITSCDELPPPSVAVIDVSRTDPRFCDLSDHRLLLWPVLMNQPPSVYHTTVSRPWRHSSLI